ncbi:NACHT domain-containing protein [Streptomyces cavourensis]|uniref:NACHT domain-containing protein n=1 Tax=Streptomyces cavourensis TaxID=67258 RepID=UPI0011756E53|nr:NACHT domain-containing protein [Streptomyces cavourensis]TQO29379.1 NACHT domain-containing protein [Streptomyces cavourensis]GGU86327.1 ATP-binding protein [Streptomyces cavourensis]
MSGTEVALIRLATTVLGAATKTLLTPRPGAGLVPDPVRPLPRPPKPDRLAKVLAGRLSEAYADLPEHERLAALASVQDTFAAGALDTDRLFALELAPERLHAELSAPAPGLSARTLDLYEDLLGRCCAHLVEQLTAHPSFAARAAVEQVRAAGRARELVEEVRDRVGPRPGAADLDFEQRYAEFTAAANSRVELFGLTLGRSAGGWPLETAYIGLEVSGEYGTADRLGLDHPVRTTVRIEQALGERDRLLLRGPAGSGKSTLVQWLALNAARQSFGDELTGWNRCVPFVLRLRAFTALDVLPSPADFLRAAGVPLHGSAPAGWADRLMRQGRALVLVDGVDEVPDRLRKRTERWLKDLVVAYPRAKYVVTTRPSAVPETWLSASGFEPHTLLAMRQEDVRAFIGHWHRAAGSECGSEEERTELDRYENALRRAVGTRRDLGLLATNPLMCALLCALNRDRRMQLPRARKELYDAALDMLLVRRDTEREIVGVEGVDLTREEQTALLQRLAYWLIRNGLVEARQEEAVGLLTEWLRAMSQVRGTPDQVFTHLLNRSGLLREPAPGSVGFVHRTFQDYLGAKAAVEARDFGVLVRHAHEDQWDDVVQMAVGHARPDERAVLLRGLLKRADAEPEHGHRLVLLAAGSLAHAPELDPGVREEVEERTAGLLPPVDVESVEELAKVGDLAVELLASMVEELEEREAAAVVQTATAVGSDVAYELVKQFREDDRGLVASAVSSAWKGFDTDLYAREVLAARAWENSHLAVTTDAQLSALRHLPLLRNVHVTGNRPDLTVVTERPDVEQVFVYRNDHLSDVAPLAAMPRLREIGLSLCPQVRDIEPLVRPGVEWLSLAELHPALDPSPLARMRDLRYLALCHPFTMESVGELPVCEQVTGLELLWQTRYMNLEGLEQWTGLRELTLYGATHFRQLSGMRPLHGLSKLRLLSMPELDLRLLSPFTALTELLLSPSSLASGLEPLTELPFLETLVLYGEGPYDLAPLAATENLTIQLAHNTHATGTHRFPPDRIIRHA